MPRAVNLAAEPPPEANCYACGGRSALNHRARSRRAFRCPACHADNRVGADGHGRPLRGSGERVADMAQICCSGCGMVNRVPARWVQVGRFTCCACRQLQRVPATLRRRARVHRQGGWVSAILLLVLSLGVAGAWASALGRWQGEALDGAPVVALPDTVRDYIILDDVKPAGRQLDGMHFVVSGRLCNVLARSSTFHLKASLLADGRPVASNIVSLPLVAPGEVRPFQITLVLRNYTPGINAVELGLAGLS